MQLQGACHCRNIRFQLAWEPEPREIPARSCTCSFCIKHGGVWTSCPTGKLRVDIVEPEKVARYSFGTRTAEFHICSACGVVPVVTSLIDQHLYAVVSVNALENLDRALLKHASASFEGEDETARLARRKRGWIAEVEFHEVSGRKVP
jgi:hypothetical protein